MVSFCFLNFVYEYQYKALHLMELHVTDNVRKCPRVRNSKFILKKQEAHGVNSKLISTNKLSRRVDFLQRD